MKCTTTLAVGAMALLASGCATQQIEQLQAKVAELEAQLTDLQKNQAGQQVMLEGIETDVFVMKDKVETFATGSRARLVHTPSTLPEVKVRPTGGGTRDLNQNWQEEMGGGSVIVDSDPPPTTATEPEPKAPPTPKAKPSKTESRAAIALYKESYALVKRKKFTEAIDGFQKFIERYPTHDYADNALYWTGESYYARGLWRKSLEVFQNVIMSYPMGNKAPDAMLKLGLCHAQLRNTPQAREVLTQVSEIYPKHPVARLARTKLEQLP